MPMIVWKVVAEEVPVRERKSLDSPVLAEKLLSDALVKEVEVDGNHLRCVRLLQGPSLEGWVSIEDDQQRTLVERTDLTAKDIRMRHTEGDPLFEGSAAARTWQVPSVKKSVQPFAEASSRGQAARPEPSSTEDWAPRAAKATKLQPEPASWRAQGAASNGTQSFPSRLRGLRQTADLDAPSKSKGTRQDDLDAMHASPREAALPTREKRLDPPLSKKPEREDVTTSRLSQDSAGNQPDGVEELKSMVREVWRKNREDPPVDEVLQRERASRAKMMERFRELEELQAAKVKEIQQREDPVTQQPLEPDLASVVHKSKWTNDSYPPVRSDGGKLFFGNVQAAWVCDSTLYVVKDGKVAAVLWDDRIQDWGEWDGCLNYWGEIFEGPVQAAWFIEGELWVVKQGRVAKAEFFPGMREVKWNGEFAQFDAELVSGDVKAAWIDDEELLYVVKRMDTSYEVWITTWGDDWVGRRERNWPVFSGGSWKTAFLHEKYFFVVKAAVG